MIEGEELDGDLKKEVEEILEELEKKGKWLDNKPDSDAEEAKETEEAEEPKLTSYDIIGDFYNIGYTFAQKVLKEAEEQKTKMLDLGTLGRLEISVTNKGKLSKTTIRVTKLNGEDISFIIVKNKNSEEEEPQIWLKTKYGFILFKVGEKKAVLITYPYHNREDIKNYMEEQARYMIEVKNYLNQNPENPYIELDVSKESPYHNIFDYLLKIANRLQELINNHQGYMNSRVEIVDTETIKIVYSTNMNQKHNSEYGEEDKIPTGILLIIDKNKKGKNTTFRVIIDPNTKKIVALSGPIYGGKPIFRLRLRYDPTKLKVKMLRLRLHTFKQEELKELLRYFEELLKNANKLLQQELN